MLNITKIKILETVSGNDYVTFETDKISPFDPGITTDNLVLNCYVPKNIGEAYALKHFEDVPEVIKISAKTGVVTVIKTAKTEEK